MIKVYLFVFFFFSSCQMSRQDVLDDLGQDVLKSKEDLEIDIKSHKRDQ